jgi:hypothetical protein
MNFELYDIVKLKTGKSHMKIVGTKLRACKTGYEIQYLCVYIKSLMTRVEPKERLEKVSSVSGSSITGLQVVSTIYAPHGTERRHWLAKAGEVKVGDRIVNGCDVLKVVSIGQKEGEVLPVYRLTGHFVSERELT